MFTLIASYPKSGNTYVRIFLAHYLRGETDLNKTGWPIYSSVANFPLGITQRRFLFPFKTNRLAKTHECGDVFSHRNVSRAVCIVRNPLDVCPSYARHMSIGIDRAITAMANPRNTLKGTDKIFPQKISSWSRHVISWMAVRDFPVFFVRYETMIARPDVAFERMLHFLCIPMDKAKFDASLHFTRFENLKKKEETEGFKEARGSTGKFFNVGTAGQWKEALTKEQTDRIVRDHGPVMKSFGYIPLQQPLPDAPQEISIKV